MFNRFLITLFCVIGVVLDVCIYLQVIIHLLCSSYWPMTLSCKLFIPVHLKRYYSYKTADEIITFPFLIYCFIIQVIIHQNSARQQEPLSCLPLILSTRTSMIKISVPSFVLTTQDSVASHSIIVMTLEPVSQGKLTIMMLLKPALNQIYSVIIGQVSNYRPLSLLCQIYFVCVCRF